MTSNNKINNQFFSQNKPNMKKNFSYGDFPVGNDDPNDIGDSSLLRENKEESHNSKRSNINRCEYTYLDWSNPSKFLDTNKKFLCSTCGGKVPCLKGCFMSGLSSEFTAKKWILAVNSMLRILRINRDISDKIVSRLLHVAIYFERNIKGSLNILNIGSTCFTTIISLLCEAFILSIAFKHCRSPTQRFAIITAASFKYVGPSALNYLLSKDSDLSYNFNNDKWIPESFISFVDKFEDLFDNEIVESITTIFYEAIHLHLVPKWAVNRLKYCINVNHYVPKGPVSIISLLSALAGLADACVGTLTRHIRGEKSMKVPTVRSFMRSYNLIKLDVDFVKFANSTPHDQRILVHDHMSRIRDCIKVGKDLQIQNRKNWRTLDLPLRDLRQWELEYSILSSGLNREAPIGIILHGLPGVGKSSLLSAICKIWCKHSNVKYDPNMVYRRNIRSKHWSKYDPFSHPIIHYSELGSSHPNIVQKTGDDVLAEVLSVIDTAPYPVEMAEIESKGKIFVMPKLVIIDTNNEELNAKHAVYSPSAVLRRFIYIHVQVRDKFSNGKGGLDPDKIRPTDNPMDLWDFDVYKKQPIDELQTQKVYKYNNSSALNMGGLRDVLYRYMDDREEYSSKQERATCMDPDDYVESNFKGEGFVSVLGSVAAKLEYAFSLTTIEQYYYWMVSAVWRIYFLVKFADWTFKTLEEYKSQAYYKINRGETNLLRNLMIAGTLIAAFKVCLSLTYTLHSFVSEMSIGEAEKDIGADFPLPRKRADGDTDYREVPNFSRRIYEDPRKSNHPQQIISSIKKNVRNFKLFFQDGSRAEGHLMGIRGNMAIINTHYFKIKDISHFTISKSPDRAEQYVNVNIKSIVTYPAGNDITFIFVPGLLFKDISKLLPLSTESLSGYVVNVEDSKPIIKGYESAKVESNGTNYVLDDYICYKNSSHGPGLCGSPIIVKAENYTMLGGIHTAGSDRTDECLAAVVTYDMAEDAYKSNEGKWGLMFSEGSIQLPSNMKLVEIHPKHPFNYENTHQFFIYGDIKGARLITGKSNLRKYPFYSELEKLFCNNLRDVDGNPKFGIPLMKPTKINGSYISPYNNWVRKLERKPNNIDLRILEAIENSFFEHISSSISTRLSPLTADTAIRGYEKDFYTRPMNKQTSAGFGYEGKKLNYIKVLKSGEVELSPRLEEDVIRMYSHYAENDELSFPLINATMKDEVLPYSKCINGKTRFFCASPIPAIVLQSMLLKPFYSLMTEKRDLFKCKIGINMDSAEAHHMYKLLSWGRIFEGDYSGYDVTIPFPVSQTSINLTVRLCKHYGYNEKACKVLRGVLEDGLFPHLVMRGSLFCVPGLQPSGKVGTAEDNSLKGVILLAYFFSVLYTPLGDGSSYNINQEYSLDDFWKLSFWVYGDDMIGSVTPEFEEFNALNYSKFCSDIFGMKFTSANKSAVETRFVKIEDMTFLKRYFVYHTTLQRYVAPLDRDSIIKMLMYYMPSVQVSEATQATETFNAALRQMYFWMDDKVEFNKLVMECRNLLIRYYKIDEVTLMHYLPTHDSLTSALSDDKVWKAESSVQQKVDTSVPDTMDMQTGKLPGGLSNEDSGFVESNTNSKTIENKVQLPKPMSPTPEELLNNFVHTYETSRSISSIFPYIIWLKQSPVWRVMKNYASFRCDLEVRFEWSVKPTDYGYGYAAHYPAAMHNPTLSGALAIGKRSGSDLVTPYLSQNTVSTEIWYEQANTATLHIPFLYYHNMIEIGNKSSNWMHELRVLSTLVFTITANERYPIRVYMRGKNVVLGQHIYRAESKVVQNEKHLDEGETNVEGDMTPKNDQFKELCTTGGIILHKRIDDMRNFREYVPVNPCTHVVGAQYSQAAVLASPIAVVGRMHKYWSSDVILTFTISAPQFLRGRIYIQYRPPGVPYGIIKDIQSGIGVYPTYIMDLSVQRRRKIKVPMSQHRTHFNVEYLESSGQSGPQVNIQNKYDACNGHFVISPDNFAFAADRVGCVLTVSHEVENLALTVKKDIPNLVYDREINSEIQKNRWVSEAALIPFVATAVETALDIIPIVQGAIKLHDTFAKKTEKVHETMESETTTVETPKKEPTSKTLVVCRTPPFPVRFGRYWVIGNHNQTHDRVDIGRPTNFTFMRLMYSFMRGSFIQSFSCDDNIPMLGVALVTTSNDKPYKEIQELPNILPMTNTGGGHININSENVTVSVPFNKMILMEHAWVNPVFGPSYGRDETYAAYNITNCTKYRITHKIGKDFQFIHLVGGLFLNVVKYSDPNKIINKAYEPLFFWGGASNSGITKRAIPEYGTPIFDAEIVEPIITERIVIQRPEIDTNDYESLAKMLLAEGVPVSKGKAERVMNSRFQNGDIDVLCSYIVKLSGNIPIHESMKQYDNQIVLVEPTKKKTTLEKLTGKLTPIERGKKHGFTDVKIDTPITNFTMKMLVNSQIGIIHPDLTKERDYGSYVKDYLSCVYSRIRKNQTFKERPPEERAHRYRELRYTYFSRNAGYKPKSFPFMHLYGEDRKDQWQIDIAPKIA